MTLGTFGLTVVATCLGCLCAMIICDLLNYFWGDF